MSKCLVWKLELNISHLHFMTGILRRASWQAGRRRCRPGPGRLGAPSAPQRAPQPRQPGAPRAAARARVSPRPRHRAQRRGSAREAGQVPQRATRWLGAPAPGAGLLQPGAVGDTARLFRAGAAGRELEQTLPPALHRGGPGEARAGPENKSLWQTSKALRCSKIRRRRDLSLPTTSPFPRVSSLSFVYNCCIKALGITVPTFSSFAVLEPWG